MRAITFYVFDLNGTAWPQVLDVDRPVQHLLPGLAQALDMPRELNYLLIPTWSNLPIDGRWTLAQAQIPAGAQLLLRPVRDSLLKQLLDKLYDEAKDEVKDKLMDAAKAKLKKIFNLDPSYPDPFHLKEQCWGAYPQAQFQQQTPKEYRLQSQAQYQQPGLKEFRPQAKPGSPVGWIIAGILGGGALLAVVGAIAIGGLILLFKAASGTTSTPTPPAREPVLGTGDVQITLRWDVPVDLDLHVVDPAGQEISYTNRTSSSGGNLDVDANSGCEGMVSNPVENVFWPYGGAPSGQYQVNVVYFMNCGYSGLVNYEVTIKQNDQVVNVLNGTIAEENESQLVTSFNR